MKYYAFITGFMVGFMAMFTVAVLADKKQVTYIETQAQLIEAQNVLIEAAQSELEYHTGDYSFCDGDEYQNVVELTNRLEELQLLFILAFARYARSAVCRARSGHLSGLRPSITCVSLSLLFHTYITVVIC